MQLAQDQITELADALLDRTKDFINEEAWHVLFDDGIVLETTDEGYDIVDAVLKKFYNPELIKDE